MHFRQTVIPILLVMGISLPGISIYWLTLDRESLLRSAGPAVPIVLTLVGLVMLLLGIANMMAVKHDLQRAALTEKSL